MQNNLAPIPLAPEVSPFALQIESYVRSAALRIKAPNTKGGITDEGVDILRFLARLGYSNAYLAEQFGLDTTAVSAAMHGKRKPSVIGSTGRHHNGKQNRDLADEPREPAYSKTSLNPGTQDAQ